jgi:phosphonate transport system substrate-binding protein
MLKKTIYTHFIGLMAIFLALSCKPSKNDIANPKKLVIAAIPGDDLSSTLHHIDHFAGFLSKKLDMKVSFYKATDYAAVIEAMKTGKVHIAYFGPFSYVLASEKAGAEVVVTLGTANGGYHSYTSLLCTHPSSGLETIEDVKNQAGLLTFCFTDPASTSGHLVPRAYLKTMGIEAESSFKQVSFSTSHAASLMMIKSQKVELAASNNVSYRRLMGMGKAKADDIKILWESEPIAPDPWAVQKDLSPELKEKIRDAFIALSTEGRDIWLEYLNYEYKGDPIIDSLVFLPANDSIYDNIREISRNIDFDQLGH